VIHRRTSAACLVAAALLHIVSTVLWPAGSEGDAATQLATAAAHPGSTVLAASLDMLSWWLLVPAVIGLVAVLPVRGRTLALVSAVLTTLGAFAVSAGTMLNFVVIVLGREHADPALYDVIKHNSAIDVFVILLLAGVVGQLLIAAAAWRGRLVAWWVPVLMLVGAVATEFVFAESTGLASALGYLPVLAAQVVVARRVGQPTPGGRPYEPELAVA
jgi:Domain of unknown function (DUF4386)